MNKIIIPALASILILGTVFASLSFDDVFADNPNAPSGILNGTCEGVTGFIHMTFTDVNGNTAAASATCHDTKEQKRIHKQLNHQIDVVEIDYFISLQDGGGALGGCFENDVVAKNHQVFSCFVGSSGASFRVILH